MFCTPLVCAHTQQNFHPNLPERSCFGANKKASLAELACFGAQRITDQLLLTQLSQSNAPPVLLVSNGWSKKCCCSIAAFYAEAFAKLEEHTRDSTNVLHPPVPRGQADILPAPALNTLQNLGGHQEAQNPIRKAQKALRFVCYAQLIFPRLQAAKRLFLLPPVGAAKSSKRERQIKHVSSGS